MAPKFKLKENDVPKLKMPKFRVDTILDEKLNKFEITQMMNRSNFTLFLGAPGSGKTSMLTALLHTKECFHKVFTKIYVFMPANSRASIKDSFFDKYIHPSQIFEEVTLDNLEKVAEEAQENADDDCNTLIVFDDTQKYLRDKTVRKQFLHMMNNRRHLRLSCWLAAQNYKSIEPSVRSGITDMFLFKLRKKELETIFAEQIEMHQDAFEDVIKLAYNDPHDFLYINCPSQRMFSNWNEIISDEE